MSKIAFALDVGDHEQAAKLIETLEPHVGAFKIGLEYFIANGKIPETKLPIILDLKVHDIPETVSRAVWRACELSERIRYITMHVQQRKTIEDSVSIAEQYGVTLLGVTVLTSMSMDDMRDVYGTPEEHNIITRIVHRKMQHGVHCGLKGFVCSPQEVKTVREILPDVFLLVPGVRPIGSKTGDQKRIGTPGQTVVDGASMVVVGRPIRDAEDPVAAAKQINSEIEEATRAKQ